MQPELQGAVRLGREDNGVRVEDGGAGLALRGLGRPARRCGARRAALDRRSRGAPLADDGAGRNKSPSLRSG